MSVRKSYKDIKTADATKASIMDAFMTDTAAAPIQGEVIINHDGLTADSLQEALEIASTHWDSARYLLNSLNGKLEVFYGKWDVCGGHVNPEGFTIYPCTGGTVSWDHETGFLLTEEKAHRFYAYYWDGVSMTDYGERHYLPSPIRGRVISDTEMKMIVEFREARYLASEFDYSMSEDMYEDLRTAAGPKIDFVYGGLDPYTDDEQVYSDIVLSEYFRRMGLRTPSWKGILGIRSAGSGFEVELEGFSSEETRQVFSRIKEGGRRSVGLLKTLIGRVGENCGDHEVLGAVLLSSFPEAKEEILLLAGEISTNNELWANLSTVLPATLLNESTRRFFKRIVRMPSPLHVRIRDLWSLGMVGNHSDLGTCKTVQDIRNLAETVEYGVEESLVHVRAAAQVARLSAEEFGRYVEWLEGCLTPAEKDSLLSHSIIEFDGGVVEVLKSGDPLGPLLGIVTDCCQHPEGAGRYCARHGYEGGNGNFIVVRDNEGTILAQSWVWLAKIEETKTLHTSVVFDSIEVTSIGKYREDEVIKAYEKCADHFICKGADVVNVGMGYAKFTYPWPTTVDIVPVGHHGYSDAGSQVTIKTKKG